MDKHEIAEAILRLGILNNVQEFTASSLKKKRLDYAFSFDTVINDREVKLLIGFESSFPLSMPRYFISDYNNFAFIPHVEEDGKVCYTHDDYVYLNAEDPAGIIAETYALVKSTIEKGLMGANTIDFANEFMNYWSRLKDVESISGNMVIPDKPVVVKIGINNGKRFVVSEDKGCINTIHRFMNLQDKGVTYQNSVLIPFVAPEGFMPPKYHESLSIDYLKEIVELLDADNKKILVKIGSGLRNRDQYVFFTFRQPDGNSSIFGAKFSNVASSGFPLLSDQFQGKLIPVHIDRLDKEYLYKRGGNGSAAFNKRGLIIGGGSVGGFIAEELVRNGFFDLTIIDGGILTSDNCYRHLTGYSYVGKNKAEAIKSKIELYFPHSNITAIDDYVEGLVPKKKIAFNNYDFIIVATGNVTINTYLNKVFLQNYPGLPIIYTWNDPYGIGGHCLVTNINQVGCYTCLYSNEGFYNIASFASKNQPKSFLKSISGCGSVYTPYGSIDSIQTCILAVKKTIDVMNGTERNGIYSWKGNTSIFLREGYNLSARYNMTAAELEERQHAFGNSNCSICTKKL